MKVFHPPCQYQTGASTGSEDLAFDLCQCTRCKVIQALAGCERALKDVIEAFKKPDIDT